MEMTEEKKAAEEPTRTMTRMPEPASGSGKSGRPPEQARCSGCGHPMAADQRYCLECGARRGGPRVQFDEYLGERASAEQPGLTGGGPPPPVRPVYPVAPEPDNRPVREVTPLMAAAGLMAFALILIFGVLIGKQGNSNNSQPQIVASTGVPATATPSTSTSTDTTVSFQADWPAGQEGFTIELATLSKEGTDPTMVESTKTELSTQGASEVGVLDSDEFGTLPGGNYVFYSGVYSSRGEAENALSSLSSSFPEAQVIEVAAEASVTKASNEGTGGGGGSESLIQEDGESESTAPVEASDDALKELNEDLSAEEYQEAQQKLPTTIETEGKPPPKDNKAPGGGSGGAVEIG